MASFLWAHRWVTISNLNSHDIFTSSALGASASDTSLCCYDGTLCQLQLQQECFYSRARRCYLVSLQLYFTRSAMISLIEWFALKKKLAKIVKKVKISVASWSAPFRSASLWTSNDCTLNPEFFFIFMFLLL